MMTRSRSFLMNSFHLQKVCHPSVLHTVNEYLNIYWVSSVSIINRALCFITFSALLWRLESRVANAFFWLNFTEASEVRHFWTNCMMKLLMGRTKGVWGHGELKWGMLWRDSQKEGKILNSPWAWRCFISLFIENLPLIWTPAFPAELMCTCTACLKRPSKTVYLNCFSKWFLIMVWLSSQLTSVHALRSLLLNEWPSK